MIDVNQPVSRVMSMLQPDHLSRAIEFRKYLFKYNENKDLIRWVDICKAKI